MLAAGRSFSPLSFSTPSQRGLTTKSLLLRGATVITASLDSDTSSSQSSLADILISDDKISAVGQNLPVENAEVVDATGRIILPGFVNAHMHTWQTALRGTSYNMNLLEYLQQIHGRYAPRYQPEDMYIGTLAGALNQINCGTTTLGDWCHNNPTPAHTDSALEALKETGLRTVFLHSTPPAAVPSVHPKEEIERLLQIFPKSPESRITIGMAIPGPLYSPLEIAKADLGLAKSLGVIVSFHHSGGPPPDENAWDVLASAGLFGPWVNIVHGNRIDDALLKLLTDCGVSFTVTPEVEMSDGHGSPITARLKQLGHTRPSIGIDIETAVSGDMPTATRMALAYHRFQDQATCDPNTAGPMGLNTPILPAEEALRWATIHGAQALGLGDQVGSLEPGKQADLIIIDPRTLGLWPVNDPITTALQATPHDIEAVMIGGQWKKRNRALVGHDLEHLQTQLAASARRLLSGTN